MDHLLPSIFWRTVAFSTVFLMTAIAIPAQSQTNRTSAKKLPIRIYIYDDDLGYGELGSYGQQKIRGGRTSDHVSVPYDLMAMLAELTGQKVAHTGGVSFLPELLGNTKSQKQHAYLYFEYPEKGGQVAIRMGDWKDVRTGVKRNKQAPWQIYNLRKERSETTNVADHHPELLKKFNATMLKEHRHAHMQEWEFIDPRFEEKAE